MFSIYIVLNSLDHHDGIIHHDPDRQDKPEHRQGIDRKTKRDKKDKGPDDRHRDSQDGDERRPPVLKKKENYQRYKPEGNKQGLHDIIDRYFYNRDGFKWNLVVDVGRKIFL